MAAVGIVFVMYFAGQRPSGGVRIIYEHANRLAAAGHPVTLHEINHPRRNVPRWKYFLRYVRHMLLANRYRRRWFLLNPDIRIVSRTRFNPNDFADDSIVIATAWSTAPWVNAVRGGSGRGFYLIQGLETWDGPTEAVMETWRFPLTRIVVSSWLKRIADDMGLKAHLVPNALNLTHFRIDPHVLRRHEILFYSTRNPNKGSGDIIAAINQLRRCGRQVDVVAFGNADPHEMGLEGECHFHLHPSQDALRDLYRSCRIYVAASYNEGWGLTLGEAAACGCLLVASDIQGHAELVVGDVNALTFKAGDVADLAQQLETGLDDDALATRLANQANMDVQRFDWANSSRAMREVLFALSDPEIR